jgi:cytochrome P450
VRHSGGVTDANVIAELSGSTPHDTLRQLREDQPARLIEMPDGARVWLLSRYEDARQALGDPRLSKRMRRSSLPGSGGSPIGHHMLNADPPDHTRLRRLVSAGFTARRVERLEPRIAAIAAELLDAMAGSAEVDLIDAYAFPLPIQVICELLGVPSADRDSFRSWSNTLVSRGLTSDPRQNDEVRTAIGQLVGYIVNLLADKRSRPGDDLLSALVDGRDDPDRLTEEELVSMVFLMLVAGHETTVNLIGNGVYLLLAHPEQRRRVEADPTLLPAAIEEFLRYESPVQTSTFRVTTEPVSYGGVEIPAGEPVLVSLMSANRDEKLFTESDRFDVARREAGHIAFGYGIHFCLGAALARLEGRIAIGALLARYPALRLAVPVEDLRWRPGMLIRGLARLPVRYDAS